MTMSLPLAIKRARRCVKLFRARTAKAECRRHMRRKGKRNASREILLDDNDDSHYEREVFEDWDLW